MKHGFIQDEGLPMKLFSKCRRPKGRFGRSGVNSTISRPAFFRRIPALPGARNFRIRVGASAGTNAALPGLFRHRNLQYFDPQEK
jgi:hypothetical protein